MLILDIGNTRLKWGWRTVDGEWLARGAIPLAELVAGEPEPLLAAWAGLPAPTQCVGACVAAAPWRGLVDMAVARLWSGRVLWQQSTAAAAGVRNAYAAPERLGVDRWAACVGAWHLAPGPAVVVCAGTACTVDLLLPAGPAAEDGVQAVFHGGYILPGLDLMRTALAGETAQLPWAQGELCPVPQRTDDAIVSGCLWAQAGAVARLVRELPEGWVSEVSNASRQHGQVWLTGGAAPRLLPAVQDMLAGAVPGLRITLHETLILDGLAVLAAGC